MQVSCERDDDPELASDQSPAAMALRSADQKPEWEQWPEDKLTEFANEADEPGSKAACEEASGSLCPIAMADGHTAASVSAAGTGSSDEAGPGAPMEGAVADPNTVTPAHLAQQADDAQTVSIAASSTFQPRRGGPVVIAGPDGSRLLYLLACPDLPPEEKQALQDAADQALSPQGLDTYNVRGRRCRCLAVGWGNCQRVSLLSFRVHKQRHPTLFLDLHDRRQGAHSMSVCGKL